MILNVISCHIGLPPFCNFRLLGTRGTAKTPEALYTKTTTGGIQVRHHGSKVLCAPLDARKSAISYMVYDYATTACYLHVLTKLVPPHRGGVGLAL